MTHQTPGDADQAPRFHVGADTGGTFTDCVVSSSDGRTRLGKALTTPGRLWEGVLASLDVACEGFGGTDQVLSRTTKFAHGTTQALNAILTQTGQTVGILTTRGFEDTLAIGRVHQKVAGLTEHQMADVIGLHKSRLFLDQGVVRGLAERIDARGEVLVELDEADVRAKAAEMVAAGARAFAVCLLWSFVNPVHEQLVARILREEHPDLPLLLSSVVAPRIGEYERMATTALSAYVSASTEAYINRLADELRERGLEPPLLLMQSSGGLQPVHLAMQAPLGIAFSGPSGGVAGARSLAALDGVSPYLLCADVGGTSFDVSLINRGQWTWDTAPVIAKLHTLVPAIAIESIGTGGGSLAEVDHATGLLHVGPASAGADPGPACYARGGLRPTVTDAAVAAGWIPTWAFRNSQLSLDPELARKAIAEHVGAPLGIGERDAALAILTISINQMADLVRKCTLERGVNPQDVTLVAFGGAGGQYAAGICEAAGIASFVVPRFASVYSAFGMMNADEAFFRERSCPMLLPASEADIQAQWTGLLEMLEEDAAAAGRDIDSLSLTFFADLQFRQQVNRLRIRLPHGETDPAVLATAFRREYELRYGAGTSDVSFEVELHNLAVHAASPAVAHLSAEPELGTPLPYATADVTSLGGAEENVRVIDTRLPENASGDHPGPALLVTAGTVVNVPSGWRAAWANPSSQIQVTHEH